MAVTLLLQAIQLECASGSRLVVYPTGAEIAFFVAVKVAEGEDQILRCAKATHCIRDPVAGGWTFLALNLNIGR